MAKTRIEEDVYGYQDYNPVEGGSTYYAPTPAAATAAATAANAASYAASHPGGSGGGGGGGGGGGSQPGFNYSDLITQDPIFGQQQSDLNAESASDAANRAAAVQRALIQWGLVPDFGAEADKLGLSPDTLGFLKSDITPGTKDLADKNTAEGLSVYARLQKQHKDQIRAIKNALAARGMAGSGEMGSQLGDEAQQYKQQLTDSEQQLLQYITGAIAAFTGAERERKRTLAQYMMSAAERQAGMLGDAGGGFGSGGGGGGGGGLQWPGVSRQNISNAGYSDEQISNAVYSTMAARGWGKYKSTGGWEDPAIHDDGQIHQDGGGTFIWVKVGYPGGAPSTEKIYLPPPGSGGGGGGGSAGGGGGSTPAYVPHGSTFGA